MKVTYDTAKADTQSVVLVCDHRLAILTAYKEPLQKTSVNGLSGSIHSGRGFRVLIYAGTDRAKANATKADFMRRHQGTRIYMTYALPQFRIKVGDFTSRKDANELYRQLTSVYSPCMIVPDIVEINTVRKNEKSNSPKGTSITD
ncbi:MAG: SPOR domain-containing protein [Phycisphaerales bacterium]|nr:SPOR domain-containing protein [Phycisphaerales bacterium]